jgi:hypothetical protein
VQTNDNVFRTWRDPDADQIAHWAPALQPNTDFRRIPVLG